MTATPTLRLIPITSEECRTHLEKKGKTSKNEPGWQPSSSPNLANELARKRNPITLKLCANTDDIIDIDEDDEASIEPEIVRYASKYQDGSIAAIASLGRTHTTGIKWQTISRALCDVSLTKTSTSLGGKKEVAMVDLASSPPGLNAAVATSAAATSLPPALGSNLNNKTTSHLCSHHNGDNDDKGEAAAFMIMRKPAGKHAVHLDGELVNKPLGREFPLKDGTIISLYGPDQFSYQVQINQNEKDITVNAGNSASAAGKNSTPKKRKANSPMRKEKSPMRKEEEPNTRHLLRHRMHKLMVGEYTCAMCMDILVKSTFAYPCSHAFCEECSQQMQGTCPTCRGKVEGWMPARSFDTIVWAAANLGCFERDDAEYYLERRELSGEPAPTADERGSILNSDEKGAKRTLLNGSGGLMNGLISHNPVFQPDATSNIAIRTLPPKNPAQIIGNANNGNGRMAAARILAGKPAENDVICID